jgi:ABC-type glycerol-3-phosphate transport system substrate-binding protein
MRRIAILCAAALGAVALAGCGGDDDATADTATEPVTTLPTETETEPSTTTETEMTETEPTETEATETTPAQPKAKTVTIRVVGGVPQGGIARPKVKKGERIVFVVNADAGEEVHVHGYDVEREVTPGKPVRLPVTATIPGRFEVELHHPDAVLAVLTVQP